MNLTELTAIANSTPGENPITISAADLRTLLSTANGTPLPQLPPTPPKPKPVLVVPSEYRMQVYGEDVFDANCRAGISSTHFVTPKWIARYVKDPPMLTAKQLYAIADYFDSNKPNLSTEYTQVQKALGCANGRCAATLRGLAARTREVDGDE